MASFSAELHIDGQLFRLTHCSYGVHQGTQQRGRASTKVRYDPVGLVLDAPATDLLMTWAAQAHRRLPATIVFRNADTGNALESLRLPAAYCVGYEEVFISGDQASGSYQCFVTLADPSGWTLTPGGPAALIAPAAGEHGAPVAQPDSAEIRPTLKTEPPKDIARGAGNRSAFHPFEPQPLTNIDKVVGQATGYTCVAASLGMILADKGLFYSEEVLAEALRTSSFGAAIGDIPKALEALKLADQIPTVALRQSSLTELTTAVGNGGKAIVSINMPGLGNHALIVDAITDSHVHIRDPLPIDEGAAYAVKISDFNTYWNKRAIVINN